MRFWSRELALEQVACFRLEGTYILDPIEQVLFIEEDRLKL